jgi:hypothetical protein
MVQREVECDFSASDSEQAEFFRRIGAAGLGVVAVRELETSIEDVVIGLHKNGAHS